MPVLVGLGVGVLLWPIAFIHVVAMDSMEMPIVNIVDMVSMLDAFAAASLTVLMIMMNVDMSAILVCSVSLFT